MAEVLAIVGLVAAIVQFIDVGERIVHRLHEYASKEKELPAAFQDISIQLPLLINDLEQTKKQIEARNYTHETRKSVLTVVEGCRAHIEDLNDVLTKTLPSSTDSTWKTGRKALLSLHQEEKVRVIAEKLRNNIIYLTHHSVIGKSKHAWDKSLHIQEDERIRMLEWLSSLDVSSNHIRALKHREAGTGTWFVQSKEFYRWKTSPKSVAWLYGIPGCGKTVLCSTIVESMESYCQTSTTCALAYYYFDYNDTVNMTVNSFLRSLIRQICAFEVELPQVVKSFCSQHRTSGQQPSPKSLVSLLYAVIDVLQNETFIIADALDEYPESERKELLSILRSIIDYGCKDMHILVTSRNEQDIAHTFDTKSTEKIGLDSSIVDEDIRLHVRSCLLDDPKLSRLPDHMKQEIEDRLGKNAHGMFRWAVCQLDTLRLCKKPSAMRSALRELPRNLDETYGRILRSIDPQDLEDAQSILSWLAFAERALTLEEVAEAAVIRATGKPVDPDDKLIDLLDVLQICRGLVSLSEEPVKICGIRQKRRVVRFAHFSVKEYLMSGRITDRSMSGFCLSPGPAHSRMARCCLATLLHNDKKCTKPLDPKVLPLLRYSAEYWFVHVDKSEARESFTSLTESLFGGLATTFQNWLSIYDPNLKKGNPQFYRWGVGYGISPLYYASLLGLVEPAQFLLDRGMDVNLLGGKHGNALVAASTSGSEKMVTLLLDRDADPNAHSGLIYGYALHAASFCGFEPIVRTLLQRGARVNTRMGRRDTALELACEGGHESIVRLLLESGAEVNARGGEYGNALQAASERGHYSIAKLLLDRGAEVNAEGGHYGYALQAAVSRGHVSVVHLLLDVGADVNAQGGGFRDALRAASIRSHENVIAILLERGANVQPIVDTLVRGNSEADEALVLALKNAWANDDVSLPGLLIMAGKRIVQILSEERAKQRRTSSQRPERDFTFLRKAVDFAMREDEARHEGEYIVRQ